MGDSPSLAFVGETNAPPRSIIYILNEINLSWGLKYHPTLPQNFSIPNSLGYQNLTKSLTCEENCHPLYRWVIIYEREKSKFESYLFFNFYYKTLAEWGKSKSFLEMVALFHFKTSTVVWKNKMYGSICKFIHWCLIICTWL